MTRKSLHDSAIALQAIGVALLALGIYLPLLAIQYDTNGVAEALALEAGNALNKNHMLYRLIGQAVYRALQHAGYAGRSLAVLQTINALSGAVGAGLAYASLKWATCDTAASIIGSIWLGTSFVYWVFSTDAGYITMAGAFALAAIVSIMYGRSWRGIALASILTAFAILTWQANIFLIPALVVLLAIVEVRPVGRSLLLFATPVGLVSGCAYLIAAIESRGWIGPKGLWIWFTNYSDGGTLPLWGAWGAARIKDATVSAARSILPILLAVNPADITLSIQFGRIAVDIAIVAFITILVLASLKVGPRSIWFLFGYLCFVPFIVWWDPFEPKWFFVPNIFLAGFLACGLQTWMHRKRMSLIVALCILSITATNFATTIRPRHTRLGPERAMADCVAEHMKASDVFIAVEWGWPDYLGYLHGRTALNLINETASAGAKERMLPAVQTFIAARQQQGADIYMADPGSHPKSHLAWLEAQTGLSLEELLTFRAASAFTCAGTPINKLMQSQN